MLCDSTVSIRIAFESVTQLNGCVTVYYLSLNKTDRRHQIGLRPSRAHPQSELNMRSTSLLRSARIFGIQCRSAASEVATNRPLQYTLALGWHRHPSGHS